MRDDGMLALLRFLGSLVDGLAVFQVSRGVDESPPPNPYPLGQGIVRTVWIGILCGRGNFFHPFPGDLGQTRKCLPRVL
jgi:hypothetical protein